MDIYISAEMCEKDLFVRKGTQIDANLKNNKKFLFAFFAFIGGKNVFFSVREC